MKGMFVWTALVFAALLSFPGCVTDEGGDGYINEEQSLFKRYLFRKALPALFRRNSPLAGELADLDESGRVDGDDRSAGSFPMARRIDRNSIEKIIEEYNFQTAGLTDEQTAVEIGKLAGAEIIVTGSIGGDGSNFYLQLRLIDVETAEVVASSLGAAKIENEFLKMSSQAVERLF